MTKIYVMKSIGIMHTIDQDKYGQLVNGVAI